MGSKAVAELLMQLTAASHEFLLGSDAVDLTSSVKDKKYFSFRREYLSRPINQALFVTDSHEVVERLAALEAHDLEHFKGEEAARTLYTLAMSFCAANDVSKGGDKKTPATFFETLIGHLFAAHLGVNPTNAIEVLGGDLKGSLPTDFIFDMGAKKVKYHVPIKLSTRERVIQVWAHQRVVDGVYGFGRYKGVLVCLTETKLDTGKLEVTEICLPDQWRIYEMYVAHMTRIYYLDPPAKYSALAEEYPKIEVRPLSHFFSESGDL